MGCVNSEALMGRIFDGWLATTVTDRSRFRAPFLATLTGETNFHGGFEAILYHRDRT